MSTSFYPILLTQNGAEILEENDNRLCNAKSKDKKLVINFVNTYRKIIDAFINETIDEPKFKKLIKNKQTTL